MSRLPGTRNNMGISDLKLEFKTPISDHAKIEISFTMDYKELIDSLMGNRGLLDLVKECIDMEKKV